MLNSLKVGRLEAGLYRTILENAVIPTQDFVLVRDGNGKAEFLLIKRTESSFTGEWFVLGGRQNRGETMREALLRVAKREVGLELPDVVSVEFCHCQDVFNRGEPNEDGAMPDWHSVWHFHVIKVTDAFTPKLDKTSSECGWFTLDSIPPVPSPVMDALQEAAKKGLVK